jgi:hypothetical protein
MSFSRPYSRGTFKMRKRLFAVAILSLIAVPTAGRASLPIATGGGTVVMWLNGNPHTVPEQTYTLVGTFRVGSKTYKGTVTGGYSYNSYLTGGSFSGYNGKHTFTASNCALVGGAPDADLSSFTGLPSPSVKSEVFKCRADIDGTDHAPIVLDFQYTQIFEVPNICCYYGWKGYFVAV